MARKVSDRQANNFVNVAVTIEDHRVVIPSLARPEPNPARTANERADKDQQDPHQKAPAKHIDCKSSLPIRVITVAKRVRIDIRKNHQSNHDERWHYHAGNPGIEINQHLLQSEEVPRRL